MIKDANHTGSANNNTFGYTLFGNDSQAGSFTVSSPARVIMGGWIDSFDSDLEVLTLELKTTTGTRLALVTCNVNNPYGSVTVTLPKGTYNYVFTSTEPSGMGVFETEIWNGNQLELVYNKYDSHNRLIEVGEYESTEAIVTSDPFEGFEGLLVQ
ncbi:MAG: hypothetical protein WEF53_14890 [Bacteroidota bacterium]